MDKLFREIAEQYGTPFYLFDMDKLRDQMDKVRQYFGGYNLCYCIKANPFVIPFVIPYVSLLEVCSPGEFALCRYYSVTPEKIFYTGVYKNLVQSYFFRLLSAAFLSLTVIAVSLLRGGGGLL